MEAGVKDDGFEGGRREHLQAEAHNAGLRHGMQRREVAVALDFLDDVHRDLGRIDETHAAVDDAVADGVDFGGRVDDLGLAGGQILDDFIESGLVIGQRAVRLHGKAAVVRILDASVQPDAFGAAFGEDKLVFHAVEPVF